jgi:hypothetical protein
MFAAVYGFVAGFMKVYEIIDIIRASIFYLSDMVRIYFFSIKQVFTAYWAMPVLFFGNLVKF